MEPIIQAKYVISALLFSFVGLVVLAAGFFIFDRMTPGNMWKEIVEKQNIALAIVVGAMTLAIAQIIASAIHG